MNDAEIENRSALSDNTLRVSRRKKYIDFALMPIALLLATYLIMPPPLSANELRTSPIDQQKSPALNAAKGDHLKDKRLFFNPQERRSSVADKASRHTQSTVIVPKVIVQEKVVQNVQDNNTNRQRAAVTRKPVIISYNAILHGTRYTQVILNDVPCKPVLTIDQKAIKTALDDSPSVDPEYEATLKLKKRNLQCDGIPDKAVSVVLLENGYDILVFKNQLRLGVLEPGEQLR